MHTGVSLMREFNVSSMALLPFPTCKELRVITLFDSGQHVDIHPSLPFLQAECELRTWWCSSKPLRGRGGLLLQPVCSVVASSSLQCWPSIRGLRLLGSQPLPLRILSRQFALHKLSFALHFLSSSDWLSLYSSLWVPPARNSNGQHITHPFRMPAELLATDLRSPEGMQEVNHLPALDSCV